MKIINLGEKNSILNTFTAELRDKEIQKDPMRFRKNVQRIGEIMAYEISKEFDYSESDVTTPLGVCRCSLYQDPLVVGSILRAGLVLHEGFINYFDHASNAFISAYRKYKDRLNFDVHIEYIASPKITDKTLILVDPMLATGSSMELAYKALLTKGIPKKVIFASVIASEQALHYLEQIMPKDSTLFVATIDPDLDEHSYIVPGLGDAGDLAYGVKED